MTFDNSCMCLPFLSHHNFQPVLPAYAPMMPVKRQTGGERFFSAQSATVTILVIMLNKLKECVWYCGVGEGDWGSRVPDSIYDWITSI